MNCPFYGRTLFVPPEYETKDPPIMLFSRFEQASDQCALTKVIHVPCEMELSGQTPDWQTCPVVNRVRGTSKP